MISPYIKFKLPPMSPEDWAEFNRWSSTQNAYLFLTLSEQEIFDRCYRKVLMILAKHPISINPDEWVGAA